MSKHNPREVSPVDAHVGLRMRMARSLKDQMPQEKLGEKLGVSFQQIQKYENGVNRVSASRLWELSQIFDVPVSFFFEGLKTGRKAVDLTGGPDFVTNFFRQPGAAELAKSYVKLFNHSHRALVCSVAKELGELQR